VLRDPRDALVSTFFRLRELGAELKPFAVADQRIGNCAAACSAQTMDAVYDDFNDDGDESSILSLLIHDNDDDFLDGDDDDDDEDHDDEAATPVENNNVNSPRRRRKETLDDEDEEQTETTQEDAAKKKNTRFYSDYYGWHAEVARAVSAHQTSQTHFVYYEDLQQNPRAEARKLSRFLFGKSDEKVVAKAVEFASFEQVKDRGDSALRKGVTGDHRIYLTPDHWDAVCRKALLEFKDVPALKTLCSRLAADCPNALYVLPKRRRSEFRTLPVVAGEDDDVVVVTDAGEETRVDCSPRASTSSPRASSLSSSTSTVRTRNTTTPKKSRPLLPKQNSASRLGVVTTPTKGGSSPRSGKSIRTRLTSFRRTSVDQTPTTTRVGGSVNTTPPLRKSA